MQAQEIAGRDDAGAGMNPKPWQVVLVAGDQEIGRADHSDRENIIIVRVGRDIDGGQGVQRQAVWRCSMLAKASITDSLMRTGLGFVQPERPAPRPSNEEADWSTSRRASGLDQPATPFDRYQLEGTTSDQTRTHPLVMCDTA
jgi:hypothetical protein